MNDYKKTREQLINELVELRESEEKYRSLISNIPDVAWTSDKDYRIIFVGPNIERLTGYTQEEEYGKGDWISWYDRVHADDVNSAITAFQALIEGKKNYDIEYRFKKKNGKWIWIHDRSIGAYEKSGVLLADGLLSDVSERKNVEKKLRISQQRLRSMASEMSLTEERERRRIATGIHDQVTQTLAAIEMEFDALQRNYNNGYGVNNIHKIRELLDYVIRQTRSLTFDISPPVLYELGLEAALEWLTERFREEHHIKCSFSSDCEPVLLEDDKRCTLFMAVRELLMNVVKHAKAQNVWVSIRRQKKEIIIEVEDDGIGFSKAGADKRGQGFGLFSLKERLTYLGGQINIESSPDNGTKITLVSPIYLNKNN